MIANAPPPAFPPHKPPASAHPELPNPGPLKIGLGAAYLTLSRAADALDVATRDLAGIAKWMREQARTIADTPLPPADKPDPGNLLS